MSNPYKKHILELVESDKRDKRFELGELSAYCRKSFRLYSFKKDAPVFINAIDIASIEVHPDRRGQGVFTKFLEAFEEIAKENGYAVYVESILEKKLNKFLKNKGYEDYNKFVPGTDSWIKF